MFYKITNSTFKYVKLQNILVKIDNNSYLICYGLHIQKVVTFALFG